MGTLVPRVSSITSIRVTSELVTDDCSWLIILLSASLLRKNVYLTLFKDLFVHLKMWHLNVPVQWSFDRYTSILYHTEFHRARFSMHIYIYIFSCSRYGLQMTVWDIHPAWYRERGKSYGDRMGYPGNPSEALLVVLSPTYSTISVILWNIIEYHICTSCYTFSTLQHHVWKP